MKIKVIDSSNPQDIAVIVDGWCNHEGQNDSRIEHFDNEGQYHPDHGSLRMWTDLVEKCYKCGATRLVDHWDEQEWANERVME